ncbi:MAG: glycoside hydrolase domain-containing protein [Bacteroidales bacterium]
MKAFKLSLIAMALASTTMAQYDGKSQYQSFKTSDGTTFRISPENWDVDYRGNHRGIVKVNAVNEAVITRIQWRRPDLQIETKQVVVNDSAGNAIDNVWVKEINSEFADVVFEPTAGVGTYYIYYLPYVHNKLWYEARRQNDYTEFLKVNYKADTAWLQKVKTKGNIAIAKTEVIESRLEHDFWTSMGIIATASEVDALKKTYNQDVLIFTENRAFPIRRKQSLPYRWIEKGVSSNFTGYALRDEYYVWQIGVFAAKRNVSKLNVEFSDFKSENATISKDEVTCINTEGVSWTGQKERYEVNVVQNELQALWCGISIPKDAQVGTYKGTARVTDSNGLNEVVSINITVTNEVAINRGDNEMWRHSRLRWLNSNIGSNYESVKPYTPLSINGNKIDVAGKVLELQENGLPKNITINHQKVFKTDPAFIVVSEGKEFKFTANNLVIRQDGSGRSSWTASSQLGNFKFDMKAFLEADGYARYTITLASAGGDIPVDDVKLILEYTNLSSQYFMGAGLGVKGGYTPKELEWDFTGPCDSYYIGSVEAGTHVEIRGANYHGPLQWDYKKTLPEAWSNNKKGKLSLKKDKNAVICVQTGTQTITKEERQYEFSILMTPVKAIDTKHQFSQRYFHHIPTDIVNAPMANIINIHHARNLNPVINYPWVVQDSLVQYIKEQHKENRKVKLYYTIRELSTQATEVFALMSLNGEIYLPGPGKGYTWPQEHLIDGYSCAWYTGLPNQDSDASLAMSAFSRFINYYLEGLKWMLVNYEIDGIYMDDVSFDRTVMQRMRKIIEKYRPSALIDLHSNTTYSIGAANQYADFMPYIDRVWFGEHFKYETMPHDEWLVTFSGIPFGIMSEMLQGGGNYFLGMLYGASNRYYEANFHKLPTPIWKLWLDFNIEDAKMIGYWDAKAAIQSDNDLVKATVYVHKGKTLLVIGNFGDTEQMVNLKINYKQLGLSPKKVKAMLPVMDGVQKQGNIDLSKPINVNAKGGMFIILSE